MDDKDKEAINKYLKMLGSDKNVDELDAIRKRAVRTMQEWSCQTDEDMTSLPETVKDMQLLARYTLLMNMAGMAPVEEALSALEMSVEAAYNLGKTEAKK